MRLEDLDRQLQLAAVARERILRRAQMEADAVAEEASEVERRRYEATLGAERRDQELLLAEEQHFRHKQVEERRQLIEREQRRWKLDLEIQGERARTFMAEE